MTSDPLANPELTNVHPLHPSQDESSLLEIKGQLEDVFHDRRSGVIDNETARVLIKSCSKRLVAVDLILRIRPGGKGEAISGSRKSDSEWFDFLETALFSDGDNQQAWEGTAAELEAILCGSESPVRYEAREHLRYSSAMGQVLGRLSVRAPDRITRRLLKGYTLWTVHRASSLTAPISAP